MKSKHAQITIFVIIGLVILLAISSIIFFTRVISVDEPNFDVNDVSIETRPAQLLMETCLEATTIDALQEIGAQGGMLNPPNPSVPSYRGRSVLYEPYIVPYWRYLADCESPSGCEFSQKKPLCAADAGYCGAAESGYNSIQEDLEEYIAIEIETCINGFESIADQYDIQRKGDTVTAEIIFSEGVTRATLEYPIILQSLSSDNTRLLERFETEVDIDMLRVYQLADEIYRFAQQTNYYETQTMNILSVYADVEGPLPPTESIEFLGQAGGPWILPEVKDELEQNILPFMSLIRYANTANPFALTVDREDEYSQYANGFYTSFLPASSQTVYDDLEVFHQYIYDPVYVQVGDGSQLIEGEDLIGIDNPIIKAITGILIKDYRFDYDVSYPLIVSVHDPDALNGRGYQFDFALEVNVRNNYPAYQNFTYVQSLETNYEVGLGDFTLPQTHTFVTSDRHTGEAIDDVYIAYVCGDEYDIGYTSLISGQGVLEAQLPPCALGGYIRYQKDGYLGEAFPFNNIDNAPSQTFNIELWPIVERDIIVRKRSVSDITAIVDAGTQGIFAMDEFYTPVSINDSVILGFEREATSPYDTTVPLQGFLRYELDGVSSFDAASSYEDLVADGLASGFYTQEQADELLAAVADDGIATEEDFLDEEEALLGTYTMELVPGNYTIEGTLLHVAGVYLPPETIDESTGINDWFDGEDEVDLDGQSFSTWIKGGVRLSNIQLFEGDVYRDEPIVVYVLEYPIPSSWSQLLNSPDNDLLVDGYSQYLRPSFFE
jgi:hypothetical protein